MASTRELIEELRKEIRRLKTENAETRRILRERGLWPVKRKAARQSSERARALALLQQSNLVRELTPEENELAAAWQSLPQEEQREVDEALLDLQLDPPLSQLIHDLRG